MRPLTVVIAITALALVGFAAHGRFGTETFAQEGTPDATAGHPLVGTWRETSTEAGSPPQQIVVAFMADGTLVGVPPPVSQPAPGFVVFLGSGIGVWEATGPNAAAFTLDQLGSDAEGNYAGRLTVSGTREVSADGQTYTGEFAYIATDPAGNVLFTGSGTNEGTRMTVVPMEAMATPMAGTPSA